jgi:hypothetical protein
MSLSPKQAARALGMKEREIASIDELNGGGWVVTTHDGQANELDADGLYVGPYVPPRLPSTPATRSTPAVPAPAASEQPPAGGGQGGGVADGTEKEVLGWVGEDSDRAAAALAAEQAKDQPRKGLVGKLEQLLQG